MIHSLRLTYLRNIEDPYASRLLSFHPRHTENPNVLAAGLADPDRWPQLTMPGTPKPAPLVVLDSPVAARNAPLKEEAPKWTGNGGGVGGASLKYTTTILGPTRTGMFGLRTNGRRPSNASVSGTEKRGRADSNPIPSTNPAMNIQEASITPGDGLLAAQNGNFAPSAAPIAPPFSRTAEVEARRKARIEARNALAEIRAHNQAKGRTSLDEIHPEEMIQDASTDEEEEEDDDEIQHDDELDA